MKFTSFISGFPNRKSNQNLLNKIPGCYCHWKKSRKPNVLENWNFWQHLKFCLHKYTTHICRLNINSSSCVNFSPRITPTTLYLPMTLSNQKSQNISCCSHVISNALLCINYLPRHDREMLGFPLGNFFSQFLSLSLKDTDTYLTALFSSITKHHSSIIILTPVQANKYICTGLD